MGPSTNYGCAGLVIAKRFAHSLFGGAFLTPASRTRLLTVARDEYAHGLWVAPVTVRGRPDRIAHRPGQIMGANTTLLRYLGDGLTVVVLSNTNSAPMDSLSFGIARLFLGR